MCLHGIDVLVEGVRVGVGVIVVVREEDGVDFIVVRLRAGVYHQRRSFLI